MTEKELQELATQRHNDLLGQMKTTHTVVLGVQEKVDTLTTNFALHEQSDTHIHAGQDDRSDGQDDRITQLEKGATATGEHKIVQLKDELTKHEKAWEKWKSRGWNALAGLVIAVISAGASVYFFGR